MTATSVASSSQMFGATSFGQPTRSTSPAINPFASSAEAQGGASGFGGASDSNRTKRNKRNGRASDQSDNESKKKFVNPFKALGDGGNKQRTDKADGKKKFGDVKKNPFGQSDPSKKPKPQNVRDGNSLNPFATRRSQSPSRPTSSSSTESTHFRSQQSINENDPHAKKVYQQLRKDGISPPPWPSQPGNPQNKAEMAKFREKYEAYRDKVRASLTKAGLIDDPTKRKTLQHAIDFKGICEDMCPDYEKITRITEMDVHQPEKSSKTTWANSRHMVKKLARSAAGQEAPLPMDVRSVPTLRRTLDYLIDNLLRHDGRLPTLHGFLWDRTRAIRRDFTFFSSLTPDEIKLQVYVLENIARFHVTSLHLLSQEGKAAEDFVEQQELEQLGKCLLSLRDTYDDCNEQSITCENEPEFRAYYLLFHGYDPNILESLQRQWKPSLWRDSDEVRTAVSLVEALQNTQDFHGPLKDAPSLAASAAYNSYFRIIEDPSVSYTMACFAECHFPHLRRSILSAVKMSLARPKGATKDVTAEVLNKFLRFDTIDQAISFAEFHDLDFAPGENNPSDPSQQYLILDNRKPLPHRRLKHQFSRSLVEKKRGSRSLPELIHESVLEDPNAINTATNGTGEDSLFVSDAEVPQNSVSTGPKPSATINPFSPFSPSSGGSGTSSAAIDKPGITPNGTLPSSGSPFQQPTQATNPFAPDSTSITQSNPQNPFASTSSSSTTPSTGVPISGSGPSGNPPLSFNPFAQKSKTDPDPIRPPGPVSAFNPFASAQSTQSVKEKPLNPSAPGFSFPTEQNPVSTTTGTILGQKSGPNPSEPAVPKSSESVSAQPPAINIIPPPTQTAVSPFTVPPTTTSPFPSILGGTSTQQSPPTKPGIGVELSKPPPSSAVPEIKAAPAAIPPVSTTSTPQFSFPASTTSPQLVSTSMPALTQNALGLSTAKTAQPVEFSQPAYTPKLPSPPIQPPAPPRDLIGDLTRWFVKGDEGLLADFQAFMLDNILQEVYRKFEKDEAIKRQQEEEERAIAEANNFRAYSLSVKYFYRWRDNARELRLRNLRRSGRDQMRQYYEAQRAAELEAQKKAARQAARERAELENLDRPEELRDLMRHKVSRRQAEDDLLASGVLSGMDNEREVIAKIVRKPPSINGSTTSAGSKLSQSTNRGGAKTQALRQQLLGGRARSSSFRRSLPPMPSREAASSEPGNRQSKVSERWRLKAMGIVQLPDGTALPEALANERYKKSQATVGSMGPPNGTSIRRASIAGLERPGTQRTLSASDTRITPSIEDASAKNKRKRVTEDDGETNKDTASKTHSHKRVMSDAANLMSELRAMRAEMEESASWFKHQNERLQSEIVSRGSTPWDQDA